MNVCQLWSTVLDTVGVSCKGEKVIFAFKEVMMRQTFKMTYLSTIFKREQ